MSADVDLPVTVAQAETGARVFEAAVGELNGTAMAGPSPLPGWTRAHLVAHVARNADALVNLLTWARTGVETPMYSSADQRAREIEEGARCSPGELRADLLAADARLDRAIAALPEDRWRAPVRTARGRTVPAWQVPWMRAREVWVHAVDLSSGFTFAQVPEELCVALLDDVAATFADRAQVPAVRLVAVDGRAWTLGSAANAEGHIVRGPVTSLAAYATGRPVPCAITPSSGADLPELPAWL